MKSLFRFYKNWALPISILLGIVSYFVYTHIPALKGSGPIANRIIGILQPALIFGMLFLTFCKVKPTDLKPCRWHIKLLTIQVGIFVLLAAIIFIYPTIPCKLLIESAMICFICPTACAAAVVCSKLGGNASHLISYILLVNMAAAVFIPLIVPLANPNKEQSFITTSVLVMQQIFPTLICPLALAWGIRYAMPRFARRLQNTGDAAFYLWTIALTLAIAITTRSIVHSDVPIIYQVGIAIVTLICCWIQFVIGRHIGDPYGDRIAAGQAIGQKNTVFAIWIAYTFLTPVTAIAGGFYSIWHNIFNSYQLYKHRKEKGIR